MKLPALQDDEQEKWFLIEFVFSLYMISL